MVTCFAGKVFAPGPDAVAEGIRWIGSTDSGHAIPSHPWGAERRGQAELTDCSKAL